MSGPILIQGAMEVETDYLVSRLNDPEKLEWGGFCFWRGVFHGLDLVVSRTEVGEINAACATTLGVQHFRPQVVVNQGIAGGHSEDLHVGDIVVGESCIHIHALEMPQRGRGEGADLLSWSLRDHSTGMEPAAYPSDPAWVARFAAAPYTAGRKVTGRLGSGDVFNREYDRIQWLHARAGELCEDMESLSAYQVCRRFSVPCVGLRILSNNELTGEPYQRQVGVILQKFVLEALTQASNYNDKA